MSSGLYTAIIPRKHDPNQPSTSTEPPRTTTNSINMPPSLLRIVNAPPKTSFTKLKLCLKLNESDYTNPKIQFEESLQNPEGLEEPQFTFTVGGNKVFSDQAYHTVFPTKTNQAEICGNCLPELVQTVFNGQDASLMYFGAISRHKQDLLYSRVRQSPSSNGAFVSVIQWLFRIVDECRIKKKDVRYSFRVSAVYYSQKKEELVDLLSDVSSDSPSDQVKCSEDPALGITVENRSEIRVETVDQALFYLDRVYDHRVSEEEEVQRSSHVFFYLTLYRYKSDSQGLQSGKSRLCLIDLGLGEKNSKTGYMTMPVLGNILLAIFQGQKHLPSRQNSLCRLLKESIGSTKNKSTVVLSTFNPVEGKCPVETENLVQLAAKMHRAVRKSTASPGSRRSSNYKSDSSNVSNGVPQSQGPVVESTEYNSSSEQSCAETVIFLGNRAPNGMGYNGSAALPPVPGSPLKRKSSSSKGSHSGRRSNNSFGTPEPTSHVIPIDCPPNAIVHSSASLHSLSSPKRPCHLFQKTTGSMPSTPIQGRSARQSSVPTDLVLCNPAAISSSEKLNGSLKRCKKQNMNQLEEEFFNIDPEKREMVLNWVMEQKVEYGADICGIGKPFPQEALNLVEKYITNTPNKVDSCIQCNEEEIDAEFLNIWNQARFLDDIVEDDEEPSVASMKSPIRESLVDKSPLNILSKESDVLEEMSKFVFEKLASFEEDENNENAGDIVEMTDEELEKAMAASINSIKSHEILSKIKNDFPQELGPRDSFCPSMLTSGTGSKTPTEMDMFRRASQLEAYAAERLREIQSKESEKKDYFKLGSEKLKQMLHCTDPTTTSIHSEVTRKSGLSGTLNPPSPKILNLEKKKEESILTKLKLKQLTCCNPMTTSVASSTSIGTNTIHSSFHNPFKTVKVSSTKPMRTLSPTKEESPISPLPPEVAKQITDQLRSAGLGKAPSVLPVSTSPKLKKDQDAKKSKTKNSKERKGSVDLSQVPAVPSPYSKVTTAKVGNGTYSSGHGSDETGSNKNGQSSGTSASLPQANNFVGGKNRPRNRESFSASSGYESADYGKYKAAIQSPNNTANSSGIK
ncbi:hypothetical protein FO519_009351, partial [Halicephalobus sp. NKZ332]